MKEVEVNIRTRKRAFEKIGTGVDFNQKQVYLERNPCFQHQIMVVLKPPNAAETTKNSDLVVYNEMHPNVRKVNYYKTFYSGLLEEEVVQKTCLKINDTSVTIPDSPEPIKDCIELGVKKGNAKLGQDLRLSLKVVNPEEDGIIDIDAVVEHLTHCPEDNTEVTEENKTEEPCLTDRGGNSICDPGAEVETKIGEAEYMAVVAVPVICSVVLMIRLCKKRSSTSSSTERGRVDVNPVYGECEAYYEGGERMQVEDASPYYGSGEEGWDDVVTDRNAFYDS